MMNQKTFLLSAQQKDRGILLTLVMQLHL